ncbi:hypothetical protein B5566_02635 [Mycobacterium sp. MHSD3]|nr:hypothetical protein B5566_02635 [Mycobacterium sp. MHSD3]
MTVYTTCGACRTEHRVDDPERLVHPGCRPPARPLADQLLNNFTELVHRLMDPGYTATAHDELNLDALRDRIEQLDAQPPRLAEAAVIYAQWGWPVFPLRPVGAPCRKDRRDKCARLCQCPKTPATPNGFKDATTDVDRVRRYWDANPAAGIGLATGHAFDVIDVDLPEGPASWAAMQGKPDIHGQVSTASGGLHAYILPTGKGNGARICPGVDYRGLGGYVVAPPTWLGARAHQWTWVTKPGPQIINETVRG